MITKSIIIYSLIFATAPLARFNAALAHRSRFFAAAAALGPTIGQVSRTTGIADMQPDKQASRQTDRQAVMADISLVHYDNRYTYVDTTIVQMYVHDVCSSLCCNILVLGQRNDMTIGCRWLMRIAAAVTIAGSKCPDACSRMPRFVSASDAVKRINMCLALGATSAAGPADEAERVIST